MTDARFPDRWLSDRRIQRLSDAHFRSYITSLVWSVSNRTDGVIEPDDLKLIPNFAKESVRALIAAGLWEPMNGDGRGWRIVDYDTTQTTALQLRAAENARAKQRDKKARQRALKREPFELSTSNDGVVPGDVPGDNTGQDRPGKDRPGLEGDQLPVAAGAENQRDWPAWQGTGSSPFDEYK